MSFAGQTDDLVMQADLALANGNLPAAVDQLQKAVEASPNHATAWKKLTMALVGLQRYADGERAGRTAAALQPGDADVHYALGYSLLQIGQPEAAVTELDSAVSLNVHHEGARQALNAALLEAGTRLREDDPQRGEGYLNRAHKLYPEHAPTILAMLDHYQVQHAKGKVTTLLKELPARLRDEPTISAKVDQLARDSEFANAVRIATVSVQAAAPNTDAKPDKSGIQYVPCPNCRQPIADFAAICPHCNFRNRATGTFAGRDMGPDHAWQDITLNVLLFISMAMSVYQIIAVIPVKIDMIRAYVFTIEGGRVLLSLLVLFRNDLAITIMKYLTYFAILGYAMTTMMVLMMGAIIPGLIALLALAISCFMVYLLNWAGD